MLRKILGFIHRLVTGGEAWAAAVDWVVRHWPKLTAMLGMTGVGAWFASQIEALHALGWGVWPFAGALFALLVSATLLMLALFVRVFRGDPISGPARAPRRFTLRPDSLAPVRNRVYRKEEVPLDGKSFVNCEFWDCTFVYEGSEYYEMIGCRMFGEHQVRTSDQGLIFFSRLLHEVNALSGPTYDENGHPIRRSATPIWVRAPDTRGDDVASRSETLSPQATVSPTQASSRRSPPDTGA